MTGVDLLDTDILIDVQRRHPPAVAWYAGLTALPMASGVAVLELVRGAQDGRQMREALNVLAPLSVVWPSEADGQQALGYLVRYRLSHGLGSDDALIAATAVRLSARLCTFNQKHYRMIPGLVTHQPYTR